MEEEGRDLKIKKSRFVNVKLNREMLEGMIETYEFLAWSNKGGEDYKVCKKILNSLKKSL